MDKFQKTAEFGGQTPISIVEKHSFAAAIIMTLESVCLFK